MCILARALACALAFCALFVAPASAQGRADLFRVSGVRVDETAANARAARDAALRRAQAIAFERLVRRLATAEELARLGAPQLPPEAIDRLVAGIDIEEERATSTRYLGRLGINFNPALARAALRERGFQVVELRGATVLVAPQVPDAPPAVQEAFRRAWIEGGFGQELAPLAIAPGDLVGPADWALVESAALQAGAATALFVTARTAGASVIADLVEVGPDGYQLVRGQVSAPAAPGPGGVAAAFPQLAAAVNDRIQADWKGQIASGAAARVRVGAQAFYGSAAEWRRIKAALAAATRTLVSEVRIEAIGLEGASLSFAYLGGQPQLAAELARGGVLVEGAGDALVLRVRGS